MLVLTLAQTVLLAAVVAWTLLAVVFVNCIFPRRHAYLARPEVQENSRYPAFARADFKKWNYCEMTFCGVFLLPFRFIFIVFCIIMATFLVWVLAVLFCVRDFERPLNPCFRFLSILIISTFARLIMWLMGFTCVSHFRIPYRGQNPRLVEDPHAPSSICVSNHVSFVDIFYFLAFHGFGFMAKDGVKNTPCIGLLAKSIQCLFIERQNHNARAAMFQKLATREELIEKGHRLNPLVIFPEGTTTNNRGLIDFKKGAFVSLKPVRLFALKYRSPFSAQFNMMSTLNLFVGLCLQLRNSLAVYEFEHPIGPVPGASAEEFAENVKLLMCDEFGFEDFHNTFEHKIEFEKAFMKAADGDYK